MSAKLAPRLRSGLRRASWLLPNDRPRRQEPEAVARDLRRRAQYCRALGSSLYEELLERAAEDVESRGPCWAVLRDHDESPTGFRMSLRLLGAVHRLALEGRVPELARFYPSCGGVAGRSGLFEAFSATLEEHRGELRELVMRPVQTNEVARSAAMFGGFLQVALETGRPLRLLEVGASAGLNLRWDQYRYEHGALGWGNPASPVRLAWQEGRPLVGVSPAIVERIGCDLRPIDPRTEEGRLTLMSYVWPDQVSRMELLRAALRLAPTVPAQVDEADGLEWLAGQLRARPPDVATVVFHSLLTQQLSVSERRQLRAQLLQAARAATKSSPLAWLQMERAGRGTALVRLATWPDGRKRVVAQATLHGSDVRWFPN
jgi:hypothetical protein